MLGIALFGLLGTANAQATRFLVTEAGTSNAVGTTPIQAGSPFSVKIAAVDSSGNVVTSYNQSVTITLPEPRLPNYSWAKVTANLVNGLVDNVVLNPIHGGKSDRRIAVTDGNIATYDATQLPSAQNGLFTISPNYFVVTQAGSSISNLRNNYVDGQTADVRVIALNSDGTVDETYVGIVTLASNSGLFADVNVFFSGLTNGVVDSYGKIAFNGSGSDSISASDNSAVGVFTFDASATFTVLDSVATIGTTANVDRLVISAVSASGVNPGQFTTIKFTATNPASGTKGDNNNPTIPPTNVTGPVDFTITIRDSSNVLITSIFYRYNGNINGDFANPTTRALQADVLIPDSVTPGTFTVDVTAVQTGSGSLAVGGTPDLQITRLDYAPGEYRGGEALRFDMAWINRTLTTNSRNSKVIIASFYRVEIHLSANSVFGDSDDVLVWAGTFAGNQLGSELLPGQSVTLNDAILLPKNLPGSFFLLAKINSAGGRVSTTDVTQNFSSGFKETIGPKPTNVYSDGNDILLGAEDAKLTLLPEQNSETHRISLINNMTEADTGAQSSGLSDQPAISQDGRYTVFQSQGSFGSGTVQANTYNIFIRDALLNKTTLLSSSASKGAANGDSINSRMSSDAKYVVYQSAATNIRNADNNGYTDIFICDTLNSNTIRLTPSSSVQANQGSFLPDISGNGRFVVFESTATNIITGANSLGRRQVYLYDRDVSGSGVYDTAGNTKYTLVSKTLGGVTGNGDSATPRISRDGNYVVFSTKAPNLIGGISPFSQVVRWERATGKILTTSTNIGATFADGDTAYPIINANGAYVVFASRAKNLTADLSQVGVPHLFRAGIVSGVVTSVIRINGYTGAAAAASIDSTGVVDSISITNAGSSYTTAPIVTITGGGGTGATATAQIDVFTGRVIDVSVTNGGSGYTSMPVVTVGSLGATEPNNPDFGYIAMPDLGSFEPTVSDDGMLVAYVSESVNLLPPVPVHHIDRSTYQSSSVQNYEDRNGWSDVYISDLSNPLVPTNKRASISSFGYEATPYGVDGLGTLQSLSSRAPAMSGNGRYVAFASDAKGHNGLIFGVTNFDYLATNSVKDIYIYDNKVGLPANVADLPIVVSAMDANVTTSANLSLPLVATASSSYRQISSVEFYADGLLVSTVNQPTSTASGRFVGTWDMSVLGISVLRTFIITAVAIDSFGQRSLETQISNVTVNPVIGLLPNVVITNPVLGTRSSVTTTTVSTLLLSATASDSDGAVTSLGFYMDGTLIAVGVRDGTTFNYKAFYSIANPALGAPLAVGTHSLTAKVADNSGNAVISATVPVSIVAASGPASTVVVKPVSANIDLTNKQTITVIASPGAGGVINNVVVYANGLIIGSYSNVDRVLFPLIVGDYTQTFSYIPTTTGIINLYAVVTDYDNNSNISTFSGFTVNPNIVNVNVGGAYQGLLLRDPTNSEVQAAIKLYGGNPTEAQSALLVAQSSEFRDNGGNILLDYLGVWGRFPTYDEYSTLLGERLLAAIDTDIVGALLASADYKYLYGDLNDLMITRFAQYGLIKKFAVRSYMNLSGVGSGLVNSNTVAQTFFNSISTNKQTPTVALVNYISANFTGTKSKTAGTKLRIAGLILNLSNNVPTSDEVNGLATVPLDSIAQYYSTGVSPTKFKPVIAEKPAAIKTSIGGSATFKVRAVGWPAPTLQWYKKGKKTVLIPGASSSSYVIPNVASGDVAQYYVTVKNSSGSVSSTPVALTIQ